MELDYIIHIKNGRTIKVKLQQYKAITEALMKKKQPDFIKIDADTIIAVSMIALIEKEDDGRFE